MNEAVQEIRHIRFQKNCFRFGIRLDKGYFLVFGRLVPAFFFKKKNYLPPLGEIDDRNPFNTRVRMSLRPNFD